MCLAVAATNHVAPDLTGPCTAAPATLGARARPVLCAALSCRNLSARPLGAAPLQFEAIKRRYPHAVLGWSTKKDCLVTVRAAGACAWTWAACQLAPVIAWV